MAAVSPFGKDSPAHGTLDGNFEVKVVNMFAHIALSLATVAAHPANPDTVYTDHVVVLKQIKIVFMSRMLTS